jgi:hypothetical protein
MRHSVRKNPPFTPITYCAPHLALHLKMVVLLDPHVDGKDVLRQKR